MKDFTQPQQDFVDSMGRAFRATGDLNHGVILMIVLGLFFSIIAFIYFLHQRWHWVRGKWIFIQKYMAGRAQWSHRKSKRMGVTIETPYGPDRTLHTSTEDLSPSGMFVRANPPLKKGDTFRFVLTLSTDERIIGTAEVKWAQNRWSQHHPSGNGCRFVNLSQEDQAKIRTSLKKK